MKKLRIILLWSDGESKMHTQDLGNNETKSRGIFELNGKFTALTFSESKTFKTRKGAEQWLARRGYNADGSRKDVWQAADGTWSHCRGGCNFSEEGTAQIDLRFAEEWAAVA
jgi:hypothetical protein